MSFFGSLFGGSSATLNSDIAKTGNLADFSSTQGQKNTTAGSSFYQSLLSGDPSKTSTVLAPQINALKTSTNQDQKTRSQNGTRSGGTAAANAASSDKVHADVTDLTGKLTGSAASTLLSSGNSLLGTALGGYEQQAKLDAEQQKNWSDSILGLGITSKVGGTLGYLGGVGTG